MRNRLRLTRSLAVILLLPAFAATAPSIQLCPLNWDQVSPANCIRLLIRGMPGAGFATERPAATEPSCGVARSATTTCPMPGACPLSQGGAIACSAMEAPASGPTAAVPSSPPTRSAHTRGHCLGDPASSRAIRPQAPLIVTPSHLVALIVVAASPEPDQAPAQTAWPELGARPPTRLAEARPPVRAPPGQS